MTLKLHKIKNIAAISKILNLAGPVAYPFQFLFCDFWYKFKDLPTTAADLKAVRGGESKLAMAKIG